MCFLRAVLAGLMAGSWEHLEQIPTVKVTFVPAKFVQKVVSWNHLKQMPTVKVTFIQAKYGLATFVHISNISAVTDNV